MGWKNFPPFKNTRSLLMSYWYSHTVNLWTMVVFFDELGSINIHKNFSKNTRAELSAHWPWFQAPGSLQPMWRGHVRSYQSADWPTDYSHPFRNTFTALQYCLKCQNSTELMLIESWLISYKTLNTGWRWEEGYQRKINRNRDQIQRKKQTGWKI